MCNQYESQSETTNDTGAFGPTTKTAAKKRDQSETRIPTRRKTTTVEGVPGGLVEATNSTGVFRTTTSKTAAKERDRSEMESTGDRGAKTGKKRANASKLGKTRR